MLDDFKVGKFNVANGIVPLKAGETYETHLPQLKVVYFRNKGVLVSVWSNKTHDADFFPGHSVFVKDLESGGKVLGCELKRVKAPNQTCVPGPPMPKGGGAQQLVEPVSFTGEPARPGRVPTDPDLIDLTRGDGLTRNRDRRDRVKKLQLRLEEHGAVLAVDGMFGVKTNAALHEAQSAAGLVPSDTVDPETADLLSQPGAGSPATGLVGLHKGDGMTKGTADRRPNVSRLQRLLTEKQSACAADGKFGPGTLDALHRFQAGRELPVGDVVDQATSDALEEVEGPLVCPAPDVPITVTA